MRAPVLLAMLSVLLAGCTGGSGDRGSDPTTPPGPTSLPAKQLLSKSGNNAQCTDLLTEDEAFTFTMDEGYGKLEISFHASGLGSVGYEVKRPDGSVLDSQADYNPTNQPCNHAHEGDAKLLDAGPGAYTVVVRNQGVIGWHLLVNEVAGNATADHQH